LRQTNASGAGFRKFSTSGKGKLTVDIFEFAMEKERLSEDYYRKLTGKALAKGLAAIFGMLADEEAKHQQIVRQMKQGVSTGLMQTTVLADAKEVFSKMREAGEKFSFQTSQIELYKKAQEIEKDSRSFYEEKAKEVDDDQQKEILSKLADEENKHYFLLENIIEFVSRPQTWLENAEWHHLEEY